MKSDPALVKAYSEALFLTGLKKGNLDELASSCDSFFQYLDENAKLRVFFGTPSISSEKKEALFMKVFSSNLDDVLVQFVRMLIRRGRLELLFDSLGAFHDRYQEHLGIAKAVVTTAIPIKDDLQKKVEAQLSTFMKKQLVIRWDVDADIVGGLRFLSGDTLIDRTVARGLDELRQTLLSARVY
ncbi:MAG: ATP synthase F1 subunit delta [Candidatus Sumerlaeia bacterium]|nr:ATP synthase F1 subunit delta [Candidatus Sumerlaeia bacterium]